MKTKSVVFIVILALAATGLYAGADGAAVYKAKCSMCHGPDGTGMTAMGKSMKLRDLGSADVQKQSDKELFSVTSDGKGKMPGYKGKLSDEEINALVTFMRTLKK